VTGEQLRYELSIGLVYAGTQAADSVNGLT